MRKVTLVAKVVEVTPPREVYSRRTGRRNLLAVATLEDETGRVKLALWNRQIKFVRAGTYVRVVNAEVRNFRGELQLSLGRFGRVYTLEEGTEE